MLSRSATLDGSFHLKLRCALVERIISCGGSVNKRLSAGKVVTQHKHTWSVADVKGKLTFKSFTGEYAREILLTLTQTTAAYKCTHWKHFLLQNDIHHTTCNIHRRLCFCLCSMAAWESLLTPEGSAMFTIFQFEANCCYV